VLGDGVGSFRYLALGLGFVWAVALNPLTFRVFHEMSIVAIRAAPPLLDDSVDTGGAYQLVIKVAKSVASSSKVPRAFRRPTLASSAVELSFKNRRPAQSF
jgi:hypothetical protein